MLFPGWIFRIQSNPYRSRGSRQDYFHLSLWNICIPKNALRPMDAPATFQRCMVSLFSDMVERFLENIFMDDFSIYGNSFEQCLHHLKLVLQRSMEKNLTLNWKKCHFMVKQGIVLGHEVSNKGIEVDRSKVEVITKLPELKCLKDIRSFLGHAGFYRRFIQGLAKLLDL